MYIQHNSFVGTRKTCSLEEKNSTEIIWQEATLKSRNGSHMIDIGEI